MKLIEETSSQSSERIHGSAITIPLFIRVIVCKIYFVIGALELELLELRAYLNPIRIQFLRRCMFRHMGGRGGGCGSRATVIANYNGQRSWATRDTNRRRENNAINFDRTRRASGTRSASYFDSLSSERRRERERGGEGGREKKKETTHVSSTERAFRSPTLEMINAKC